MLKAIFFSLHSLHHHLFNKLKLRDYPVVLLLSGKGEPSGSYIERLLSSGDQTHGTDIEPFLVIKQIQLTALEDAVNQSN